jgi:hypothetical protein
MTAGLVGETKKASSRRIWRNFPVGCLLWLKSYIDKDFFLACILAPGR